MAKRTAVFSLPPAMYIIAKYGNLDRIPVKSLPTDLNCTLCTIRKRLAECKAEVHMEKHICYISYSTLSAVCAYTKQRFDAEQEKYARAKYNRKLKLFRRGKYADYYRESEVLEILHITKAKLDKLVDKGKLKRVAVGRVLKENMNPESNYGKFVKIRFVYSIKEVTSFLDNRP